VGFQVPLEGFKALQGISGPQKLQIHKAYGAPERLPSAHTWSARSPVLLWLLKSPKFAPDIGIFCWSLFFFFFLFPASIS